MLSLLLALSLLIPEGTVRAIAPRTWTFVGPISPGTGIPLPVDSIAVDALDNMLYIGVGVIPPSRPEAWVFRRSIEGGFWAESPSPNIGGLYPFIQVVTDPNASGTVYAAGGTCSIRPVSCFGALSRTDDEGENWTRLVDQVTSRIAVDPFDSRLLCAVVEAIASSPTFPFETIVATSLKSTDGGATWAEMTVPPGAFEFDLGNPGTLYLASEQQGVWKSIDSGDHWSGASVGLADLRTGALAVDRSGVLHVATASGVFVSFDGAGHWAATDLKQGMTAMIADPTTPGAVFTGNYSGVYRIDENGTATPLGAGISLVTDLATDPSGLRLWAATSGGLFEYDFLAPHTRVAAPRAAIP